LSSSGSGKIGRFVYTPILTFMVESLELTKAEAGAIASSNFIGYLLGALAAAKVLLCRVVDDCVGVVLSVLGSNVWVVAATALIIVAGLVSAPT
jgi:fucose permease